MTDSMKFGPEWLRNLSSDGSTQNPPAPKYQLAEHRYGREEMLALFDRQIRAPDRLAELQALFVEKAQPPLALIQMNEEETRMWNRGINSDAVLRLNGKPAPISIPGGGGGGPQTGRGGALVGGRGGSVDRGRGRSRGQGSYHYTRGVSYEEPGDAMPLDPSGKVAYNRNIGRPFDRAQPPVPTDVRGWSSRHPSHPASLIADSGHQSMAGGERGWGERNGGEPQDWNGSTSPRKDFVRGLDNNWRRPRGPGAEDEEGWRTATATGSTKYVRPSSWREGDKEAGEVGGGGGRWEGPRQHRGWDGDSHRHHTDQDNLPEWAMENPSESGGSFDASGAFHGGVHSEDDEDGGAGGEPGRTRKPSDGHKPRRSPEETPTKKATPPPPPPSSIAKSQSTPAISAATPAAKSSPAKSQQQQQQHQLHHPGNALRMSPSEPAFQIPIQMSANNGDIMNGPDKTMPPPTSQYALNDPSILSTQFHHLPQQQQQHQQQHNNYDPAAHYQPMAHNGGGGANSFPRFAAPYGGGLRKKDEDLDRMQEDADSLVDKLTADEEEKIHKMAAGKQGAVAGQDDWFYRDPQSEVQGPFAAQEMDEWFRAGYFNVNLLIRRGCDERFAQLGDLIKAWGRVPFLPGPPMPPLKTEMLPTPPPTPVPQIKPPAAMDPAEASILQQQYQYQQLLQRQMQMGQQAAFQAVLGKLSQSDRWTTLTLGEQQQLLTQQMMDPSVFLPQHQKAPLHQQFMPPPSKLPPAQSAPGDNPAAAQHPLHQLIQQMGGQAPSPIGQPPGPMGHLGLHGQEQQGKLDQDPIQSLIRQINANSPKPQMDVWGNPLSAQSWMPPPVNHMPTAPPPGQLPITLWDLQGKDMKTEQQIIDERMRAEEEKRVEEAKKKEAEEKRRKQHEEEQKRKEMEKQRLEQERQRQERQLEEARRKEEEEEKRALEEQKRLEEEMRKKEEKKRKEEEKRKREEEKRKKDEEKERKRKLEEDRKREEEEKKRLAALEEEEAARKRLEEEEQVRRLEQQHQAFRRMERAKAAPWSQQPAQQPAGSSLAEIQRQEKVQKERETREQQMLLQQMVAQQQQQQLQQQAAALQAISDCKASSQLQLKWADRKPQPPASKVKSLAEIQAEEAKVSEREKAERASQQKEGAVPPSAGIWSAAPQSLTWASAAPVAWGSNSTPQGPVGFWDDVIPPAPKPAPASRPAPKPKATPAAASQPPPAKVPAAKTRNKKEEAVVMKLFDNQRGDDFTHWCYTTLQSIEAAALVDIPTFVGFLRDIESPYEVRDYVKMYLGEGKEAQEFARQFLERRSKWRSAQRAAPQHDDLAQPAPAINPSCTDFTEVKGKAKKVKKNKMFKVDSRILGFSVTAAQDRINVGDRDYGEGV